MTTSIVGIDLGTTYSLVATVDVGQPRIIADAQGERLLPSVVGLSTQGELLVGTPARNQYVLEPDNTVRSIKRKMGTSETVTLAGHPYTPQEISAFIDTSAPPYRASRRPVFTPAGAQPASQDPQQLVPDTKPSARSGSSRAGQNGELVAQEQGLEHAVVAGAHPGQDGS